MTAPVVVVQAPAPVAVQVVTPPVPQVVQAGLRGERGPAGPIADLSPYTAEVAALTESVDALRGDPPTYEGVLMQAAPVYSAVVSLPDGLWIADPGNPAHAGRVNGVLTQSGAAGQRVRVALMGPLRGWGGPQGRMWIGEGGQPTPGPTGTSWRQVIGFSPEPGVFVVQLKPAVVLAT